MFLKQKDCFVPDFTQAEEIQKSGSTEQASQMEQKFPLTISPVTCLIEQYIFTYKVTNV